MDWKRITSIAGLTGLLACSISKADLYDDFNGGLDTDKWQELPGSNLNNDFLPEHSVLFNEEGIPYHTASYSPADRGIALEIKNRTFRAGDLISYDVVYSAGNGNRISTIRVDGVGHYTSLFGFWNTLEDGGVGNDFGNYHVKLKFLEEGIYPEITVPSGEVRTTRIVIPYPTHGIDYHTFGFVTRTGHDGWVHMDYDNVYISVIPEPSSLGLMGLGGIAIAIGMNGFRKK